MKQQDIFETLEKFAVIPVITIDSIESALPLADALIDGGLPVAEITFRTVTAGKVIVKLKKERPCLLLGAGTILTLENLRLAKEYGTEFGVAPGLNPEIISEAQKIGLPFFPGVVTPTEIERGINLGVKVLKFFPAEASGGVNMLKVLSAPYTHTGIKFVPTGGINVGNLERYLSLDVVLAVGGTWIAKKETIALNKWDEIRNNCWETCEVVSRISRQQIRITPGRP